MNTMIRGCWPKRELVMNHCLNELNDIDYYEFNPPKSLAREFAESQLLPLLSNYDEKTVLHTYTKHIGFQIGMSLTKSKATKCLVTGGGTFIIIFSSIKSSSIQVVVWKSPTKRSLTTKRHWSLHF